MQPDSTLRQDRHGAAPGRTATGIAAASLPAAVPKGGILLLCLLCLVPLLLFAALAVTQREKTLRTGETAVARTVQVLEEHALRVFEAQELIIEQTDQYLGTMSWDDIRTSEEVNRFLKGVANASPHVDGLWLVPPDGRTANSADFFPFPDVDVTDREYFQSLSARDEIHFGEMIVGRTKGTLNFNLSRRRSPRDSFNGVILVTSSISYFTEFWEQASGGAFVAGLFREDGEILLRYPAFDGLPQQLSPASPLIQRMRDMDDDVYRSVSSLDGGVRIYGYSRIGTTPLFIGYGVSNDQVLAGWRLEMRTMGLIALITSGLLGFATLMILRQNRRLAATAGSWRDTAEELEREVALRLRAEDVAEERRRLLDEVRTLTAQRQGILENMAEGVIALDAGGRVIYANPEAGRVLGPLPTGGPALAALVTEGRIRAADGTPLDDAAGPESAPLRGESLSERELLVRGPDGRDIACLFRGGAIFGSGGQVEGAVLTFWDVTERKRDAERRDLLMRELDHRVRNMLATIMAIIRISNEPGQSKAAFVTALSGRVGAMARTHGILSQGKWAGATIGRLVEQEVANLTDACQLDLHGDPDLSLPPKEAADLALALHELATNAIKHGAWSVPDGCVTLRWSVDRSARVLQLGWRETGGPAVSVPSDRGGFGTTLLKGLFAGSGGVKLSFEPHGLSCTIAVPMPEQPGPDAAPDGTRAGSAPRPDTATLAGARLLVVEDEAVVRLDLANSLRAAGAASVTGAATVAAALDAAATEMFDAAVLDQNLNGESSQPVARLLARRGVPFVVLSGYGGGARGREDPLPSAYLQKPVSPEELVSTLLSVLSRAPGPRPEP